MSATAHSMTATTATAAEPLPLLDSPFAHLADALAPAEPAWLAALRRAAWERFLELPFPQPREENWRYSFPRRLSLEGVSSPLPVGPAAAADLLARSVALPHHAGRIAFANARLLDHDPVKSCLGDRGVIFKPLLQAIHDHPELLEKHLAQHPSRLGSAKFSALHTARTLTGAFLYVPKGVTVSLPLEVFHWLSGPSGSAFPTTLIVAERNSQVTLVDHYLSDRPDGDGLLCSVSDIHAGEGANVRYIARQELGSRALNIRLATSLTARDAHSRNLAVTLGGAFTRGESLSLMSGPGGRSDMLALAVADRDQVVDQRTFQEHASPHTTSDLLYKNALAGSSSSVFTGVIRVDPGAHQTDAYQTCRNLMLGEEAEANSLPGLEILANDVKCSHGATTGALDEDQVFYLRSRGLPARLARQLLVRGFLQEVLERLDSPDPEAFLADRLDEKFEQMI